MRRSGNNDPPGPGEQAFQLFVDRFEEGVGFLSGEQEHRRLDPADSLRIELGEQLAGGHHRVPLARVLQGFLTRGF